MSKLVVFHNSMDTHSIEYSFANISQEEKL